VGEEVSGSWTPLRASFSSRRIFSSSSLEEAKVLSEASGFLVAEAGAFPNLVPHFVQNKLSSLCSAPHWKHCIRVPPYSSVGFIPLFHILT
jgi:hypothetical protein